MLPYNRNKLKHQRELPTPRVRKNGSRKSKPYAIEYRLKPDCVTKLSERYSGWFWDCFYSRNVDWKVYKKYRTHRQRNDALRALIKKSENDNIWHKEFEYRAVG